MTLADAETSAEALSMARQELEALTPMLDGLRRQAVFCLVDISVFVGSERQFTNGVELSPGDLAWFAERGLGFAVSAYPVSDEEEEEDA
ncbi:hypothetical protein A176_005308 [Myxococcus hansupus]|uniref:Uncharacterized protein n=2 Tax=Pseudomyxococcus hansupus TaxID=1297742 RepID=A0A0H4WY96_9BACT|nr:hypothetical protein A176_005308 [Myxococcus hansupus]